MGAKFGHGVPLASPLAVSAASSAPAESPIYRKPEPDLQIDWSQRATHAAPPFRPAPQKTCPCNGRRGSVDRIGLGGSARSRFAAVLGIPPEELERALSTALAVFGPALVEVMTDAELS